MIKTILTLLEDSSSEVYLTYQSADTQTHSIRKPGIVQLRSLSKRQRTYQGNVAMIPCGREMVSGGRLVQLGQIVFRNANLYIQQPGQTWGLLHQSGHLKLVISQGEYRRLEKRLFVNNPESFQLY